VDCYRRITDAIFKPVKEAAVKAKQPWLRKPREEEVMEIVHKDLVMKLSKKLALAEAEKVWKGYMGAEGGLSDPWHKALDNTMFWM
jgi:hypothetical protein